MEWSQYIEAAKQGDAEAQYNLGLCYYNGYGVGEDATEAVKWFAKAAEQGHAEAQYTLGVFYANGDGVKTDYAEAVKWLTKAVMRGHIKAQKSLTDVQYILGECYAKGNGVIKDYAEAVRWYRKAAEQGHTEAQYRLGVFYANGDGVGKTDYGEAVKWFTKAAEQGHGEAQKSLMDIQYILSPRYTNGTSVGKYSAVVRQKKHTRDVENTVDRVVVRLLLWVVLAVLIVWALSKFMEGYKFGKAASEGRMYMDTQSSNDTRKLTKATEQGDAEALFRRGELYSSEGNYVEAIKWYIKAAEQGHKKAKSELPKLQCGLGALYAEGRGVRKDSVEAVKWFRKAAEQEYAEAQLALGLCYEMGAGVHKDNVEAAKWYRKAAEQGNNDAREALRRLRR